MKPHSGTLTIPVAFVVAVIAALLVVPVTHCVALSVGASTMGTCSGSILGYMTLGAAIAFPASIVFGIPLFLALRRFGWLSWWQASLGAGSAGVLAALALHALDTTTYLLGSVELFGSLGAIAGVAFWYAGLRRSEP